MMRKTKSDLTFFILGLFFVSVIVSGCEPLRKKFTRQKKIERQLIHEPILDPIDYPHRVYNVVENYRYRFSLFHVWKKEFISSVDNQASSKRLRYLMDNMIDQLVAMNQLLVYQKRSDLEKAIEDLRAIRVQLDMPSPFFDFPNIRRKVNSITQRVRSKYNLGEIETYIIKEIE